MYKEKSFLGTGRYCSTKVNPGQPRQKPRKMPIVKDKGSKAKTTNKVISNAFNNTIAKEEGFTQSVTTPLLSTNLLLFQK